MTVQATFAATFTDELVRGGVTDAVVSPGSRSTPLAVALALDGRLRLHVILDERSASFFALGLGRAAGRPAVLVTTSGTAAAELHAAVVEADLDRVPMLVCTADRPPELQGVGAPQTIDQAHLFGRSPRWFAAVDVPDAATSSAWRPLAARAVAEATVGGRGPGPVHLNLAFREPLIGEPDAVVPGRRGGAPWHRLPRAAAAPPADLGDLSGRGVIVAGAGAGDPEAVHRLAERLGWPVLADPRSGCRLARPATVAAADALLRDEPFASSHRPDVVLRLGAPWASKILGQWLASLDRAEHVLVDPHRAWADPDRLATTVVAADPTLVCESLLETGIEPAPVEWLSEWREAERAAQSRFDQVLAEHLEVTEPGIARALYGALPDGSTLFVSSSMPVRDVEGFGAPRDGLRVLANRGANGIDGVVSSALGVAAAAGGPAAALVGDLAFLHDVNGLLIPPGTAAGVDCTTVVVDNGGGGIFSFLPQRETLPEARFERLFGTPQPVDIAAVAAAYGAPVTAIEKAADLAPALAESTAAGGMRVLHARTDRDANVALHHQLWST